MGIIGYQIVIGLIIIVSAFFGRNVLLIAIICLALWTVTQVFMPWLMILQFGTIALSSLISFPIAIIFDKIKSFRKGKPLRMRARLNKPVKLGHNLVNRKCCNCGCSKEAIEYFGFKCNDTIH